VGVRFAGEVAFDVVGFFLAGGESGQQVSVFHDLLERSFALGLELFEHGHIPFQALGAVFVEGHELEVLGFGRQVTAWARPASILYDRTLSKLW